MIENGWLCDKLGHGKQGGAKGTDYKETGKNLWGQDCRDGFTGVLIHQKPNKCVQFILCQLYLNKVGKNPKHMYANSLEENIRKNENSIRKLGSFSTSPFLKYTNQRKCNLFHIPCNSKRACSGNNKSRIIKPLTKQ